MPEIGVGALLIVARERIIELVRFVAVRISSASEGQGVVRGRVRTIASEVLNGDVQLVRVEWNRRVRSAAERGEIPVWRYESYLRLLVQAG